MSSLSRNIILDLLPAYIAGEASAETRALVDEFAQQDAQIARLIRSGTPDLAAAQFAPVPPNTELQAVIRLRKRIRRQGWLLGFAIFCSLTAVCFQWDDTTGFHWTMLEHPALSVILGLTALFFWIRYFQSRWSLKAGI